MRNFVFKRAALLLSLCCLSAGVGVQAQERKAHSVQASLAAMSKGFELSYEYRPNFANRLLGFRGFVGYGFQKTPGGTWTLSTHYKNYKAKMDARSLIKPKDHEEFSLGGEVNTLLGSARHAAEFGLGLSVDYFSAPINYYSDRKTLGAHPYEEAYDKASPSKWATHGYLRTGYRYTHSSGVTGGIGINILMLQGPFTYFYASQFSWTPYLSLGYSF